MYRQCLCLVIYPWHYSLTGSQNTFVTWAKQNMPRGISKRQLEHLVYTGLQCPSPPSPENGDVTVSSYYPSGIATYNCHYGYRLVGSTPARVCESEETWTGMAPSCQRKYISYVYKIQHWQVTIFYLKIVDCNFFYYVEIRCPPPTQPGNGTVNVTSNTVDGIALFYCLPTHYLDGSDRRVCMESGEWNGTQPQCVGQ